MLKEHFDQFQNPTVGHLLADAFQEFLVIDCVEVAFEVCIHNVYGPGIEQSFHVFEGMVTASPWAKAVTVLCEGHVEDWFHDVP